MRTPSSRLASTALAAAALATLAACGSPPPRPGEYSAAPVVYPANRYPANTYPANTYPSTVVQQPVAYVEYGRVSNIEMIRTEQPARGSGAGAVIGGIAGAVIGHQIGGGFGRDAATAAGAVGGAVVGNNIEKRNKVDAYDSYRVSIQVDNGSLRVYDMSTPENLRIGDRVRIENGVVSRV